MYSLCDKHPHGYARQTGFLVAGFITAPWILFRYLVKAGIGGGCQPMNFGGASGDILGAKE